MPESPASDGLAHLPHDRLLLAARHYRRRYEALLGVIEDLYAEATAKMVEGEKDLPFCESCGLDIFDAEWEEHYEEPGDHGGGMFQWHKRCVGEDGE